MPRIVFTTREPVGPGGDHGARELARCPSSPARASRRAAATSRRGRRRRSRRPTRAPRRRSGTRGSARSCTSSSRAQVSAYSCAAKPPTLTQSGTPSSRAAAASAARKRSRPGLARPIELSIPTSVSAIRTGALPPRAERRDRLRHEGVERPRGLGRGQRVEAAGGVKQQRRHRPFHAEPLPLAVDLDGAAVAGAVAAGHRRLPGELRVRARSRGRASSIGSARRRGQRVRLEPVPERLGDEHAGRSRPRRSGRAMPPRHATRSGSRAPPEAAPSFCERYGSGAIPMPPPTSSGRSTSSRKPLPSGP